MIFRLAGCGGNGVNFVICRFRLALCSRSGTGGGSGWRAVPG
ncbi:MAG TPA: hypothetical protein VMP11_09005 [Verrucomicrobiae bacterium]|nr:hypothetical protein [Verrucomicrobiae bacterium]